jgi:hypothetical protein
MKTFGKLIKHRLEEEYVSLEEQCGFTTGWSCIDHIFRLKQILEKCQEKSKQIGWYLLTLKRHMAVSRGNYWQALQQASISEHIIHTVILAGDLNARVGNKPINKNIGTFEE